MDSPNKIKIFHAKEERLANYEGDDRVISSEEMAKELSEGRQKEVFSLKAGFPSLDQWIEGVETGELIIVSGYTGMGKTSLCQTFTINFEKQGFKTLWFSYEMPARQFLTKFPEKTLFYLPRQMKDKAVEWIEDRIVEAKVKYEVKAVMIDHLHFLVDLIKMKQPSLEIGTIVRNLKQIAMKHNVILFLIAHTSMPKANKSPGLESIRDSSFVTQEADLVLVVQRELPKKSSIYSNLSWLSILKSRRTGVIGRNLKVLYKDRVFSEVDLREEEEYLTSPDSL